jgi:rubrerythrin
MNIMDQEFNLHEAVELAITAEQLGADFYESMTRKFDDDQELREIFAQLAKDEKAHEVQFMNILKTVPEKEDEPKRFEEHQFLRATAISRFFRKESFKDTDEIEDRDEALGRALAFEKDTLQYYKAMDDAFGGSDAIKQLAEAEHQHVLILMKVIMAGAKFRSLQDKW